jgi:D-3-phosphoglycerate dehydrogenase
MTKILLLERIHPIAEEILKESGFEIETEVGSLSTEALVERCKGVSVLGIRSKTNLTREFFEQAKDL